jgi:site-specific recombinase XerD
MKISDALYRFLTYIEVSKNQSPKTVENYTRYLLEFKKFFTGDREIGSISFSDIQEYRLHLHRKKKPNSEETLAPITQNYYLIALRSFIKFLIKSDVEVIPPEKIELSKTEKRIVDFLNRDELERLFVSVQGEKTAKRDRAILECLYSTGLRVSELCSLNKDNIDYTQQEFAIKGKGGKIRIVFLSERALHYIQEYLKTRSDDFAPLFISHSNRSKNVLTITGNKNAKRLTRDAVEKIVQKYRKKAGIIKTVTPHTLRHS